jgi:hypothetical protein
LASKDFFQHQFYIQNWKTLSNWYCHGVSLPWSYKFCKGLQSKWCLCNAFAISFIVIENVIAIFTFLTEFWIADHLEQKQEIHELCNAAPHVLNDLSPGHILLLDCCKQSLKSLLPPPPFSWNFGWFLYFILVYSPIINEHTLF